MHILLVEDNRSDVVLLTEMFAKSAAAPEVDTVIDGYDALDFLFRRKQYQAANKPDMIVLDLNLPRINGYEVLKEVKNTPAFAGIPVIILTTSLNPLDRAQCEALGADVCFSKPHGLKGYENIVEQILQCA